MNRRQFATVLIVVVALFHLLAPLRAAAQAGTTQYTSAKYGYSFRYDATWSVVEELATADLDLLRLSNGISVVSMTAFSGYGGDATACTEGMGDFLSSGEGALEAMSVVGSGGDADNAYNVYEYVDTSSGVATPSIAYVHCWSLIPGDAVLMFLHFAPKSAYEAEFAAVDPFFQTLTFAAVDTSTGISTTSTVVEDEVASEPATASVSPELTEVIDFVIVDIDAYWTAVFAGTDVAYRSPAAIIPFAEDTETPCGLIVPMATGSAYCPLDEVIYVDLAYLNERAGILGTASVANVIAHEWGHHIELVLGIIDPASNRSIAWTLTSSTKLETELMADCLSGSWVGAATSHGVFAASDHDAMVIDLATIGDTEGTHYDDQHGNGALRTWWFLRGLNEGASACLSSPA